MATASIPATKLQPQSLEAQLADRLIGQPEAIAAMVPFVRLHQAGLSPEGRPIGVVLLLGPTGTGKTRAVEALAEVLHGTPKSMLKVDCGEFQMEHEVAKLIGAPPGYLGHRETQPMLTQAKIGAVASNNCDISIILLDEIEKAAPSMTRLLLGILDKATLRLGDNTTVNFERCLIFMTSNLGSREIMRSNCPDFGFQAMVPESFSVSRDAMQGVGLAAVKRKFSPEFVNRIDSVVTFRCLQRGEMATILGQILDAFGELLYARLGLRAFKVECTRSAHSLLLDRGTSAEFGARELKRTVQRHLIQPVATLAAEGKIAPASVVILDARAGEFKILVRE